MHCEDGPQPAATRRDLKRCGHGRDLGVAPVALLDLFTADVARRADVGGLLDQGVEGGARDAEGGGGGLQAPAVGAQRRP